MNTRTFALLGSLVLLTITFAPATSADDPPMTHTVCHEDHEDGPCDFDEIQKAVDQAGIGDTIKILEGTYEQTVEVPYGLHGITIQGDGPTKTILDGKGDMDEHAIYIPGANDVTVKDLTTQNYGTGYGVYYSGVAGFHVDNVHAIDNGMYGIYADQSTDGLFENSLAEGHGDAGFYIGNIDACHCTIKNVISQGNLLGYSGTSASYVDILDSHFEDNAAGVVPNVLDPPPLGEPSTNMLVKGNTFIDNNNHEMSEDFQVAGFYVPAGFGVINAGGNANVYQDNTFIDHERAAIASVWLFNHPSFNQFIGNTFESTTEDTAVAQPGPGDLLHEEPVDILWDASGVNNCFEDNTHVGFETDLIHAPGHAFDAGTAWNTAGTLPDCNTPNAGPQDPTGFARQLSLMMTGCEISEHLEDDEALLNEDDCDYSTLMP